MSTHSTQAGSRQLAAIESFFSLCSASLSVSAALAAGLFALSLTAASGLAGAQPLPHAYFDMTVPDVPPQVLIGETFKFTVRFKNNGAVGYAPFVDLVMNSAGADQNSATGPCDGVSFQSASIVQLSGGPLPLPAIAQPPSVPSTCTTLPLTVAHPFGPAAGPVTLNGAGWQLATLPLPLGSYFSNQPEVVVEVTAAVHAFADLNFPLTICARGGFQFSTPTTSPSIVEGTWDCQVVTPTIFTIKKEYLGPELETATGPNFKHKYKITLDVATGQVLGKPLTIRDCLPNTVAYEGGLVVSAPSSWPAYVATQPPVGTVTNGGICLDVVWPNIAVTGAPGPDATVEFRFSVRDTDADGNPILQDCIPLLINNPLTVTAAHWTPLDGRDPGGAVTGTSPQANQIYAKCMAMQKSVEVAQESILGSIGPTPGDILKYTLDFQVSDYKSIGGIVVTDHLSDGQTFVPGSALITATDRSGNPVVSWPLPVASTPDPSFKCLRPPFTYPVIMGGSKLVFGVSSALAAAGHNTGILIGGWAGTPVSATPAQGRIVFQARIDDKYLYQAPNDLFVDKHDPLTNCVTIDGQVYQNVNPPSVPSVLSAPPVAATDDSSTAFSIVFGNFAKSVHAITRGSVEVCGPNISIACGAAPDVHPGDAVTFRLTYKSVPSSDTEDLQINDWLPVPVFNVGDFTGTLTGTGSWTPATGAPIMFCGLNPPAAGTACALGGGDLFTDFTRLNFPPYPNLIVHVPTNSLTFDYGPSVHDTLNRARPIDLLFTIVANAKPFADGLSLTNQAQDCESNTFGRTFCQVAVAPIKMREPNLKITKGAVATNNPGAVFSSPATPQTAPTPTASAPSTTTWPVAWVPLSVGGASRFTGIINHVNLIGWNDSNLSHSDADDIVTFAIVIENQGGSPAYNVQVSDFIPWDKITGTATCFVLDAASIRLTDGAGNVVAAPGGNSGQGFGFLLTTPIPALTATSATDGSNVRVITFNVKMNHDIKPGCCDNTATITAYAATADPTAPNFVTAGIGVRLGDTATVCVGPGALSKCIVGTSEPSTADPYTVGSGGPAPATIGEIVTYRIIAAIPEGVSPSYRIVDFLPPGLSYRAGSATFGLYSSTQPIASTLPSFSNMNFVGSYLPYCLSVADHRPRPTLTINPTSIAPLPVTVIGGTGSGGSWQFDLGTLTNNDNDPDVEFAVIEFSAQVLNIAGNQGELPNPTSLPNSFQVCAGEGTAAVCDTSAPVKVDIVEPKLTIQKIVSALPGTAVHSYTVTIKNEGTSTAFDVTLLDVLPACLASVAAVTWSLSTAPAAFGLITNSSSTAQLALSIEKIPVGEKVIVTYTAVTVCNTCSNLTNTATVKWTSLPGSHGTANATPASSGFSYGERDGSGTFGVNDYSASASASFCRNVCALKFNDLDGNGLQNTGELPLAGWTFNITGYAPQITSAAGLACWNVVTPGSYTITEVLQPNWIQTSVTPPVSVPQPGPNIVVKFGNKLINQVCDLKIEKVRTSTDFQFPMNFTVTNIGGLPCPGPITITDFLPAGTIPAPGSLPASIGSPITMNCSAGAPTTTLTCTTTSAFNPGAFTTVSINLISIVKAVPNCASVSAGSPSIDANLANNTSCSEAPLCAFKFHDLNQNGIYDAGEPPLAGWTFQITAPGVSTSVVTNAQGLACFNVPRLGNYTVMEVPMSGWVATTPTTQTVSYALPETRVRFGNRVQLALPWDWVHEYYNEILNHYFLTIDPDEAKAIDSGAAGPGWSYTGQSIPAYRTAATAPAGSVVECRFYGNQAKGGPNGHFYTADPAECAAVKLDPGWTFERNEFYVGVAVNGACAGGAKPVYRVYNGRFAQSDSNHRYMTDATIYKQMIAAGWAAEGVVFCAARPDQ